MTQHTDSKRRFSKTVSVKETDAAEQIATGVVMVPNQVDHQLDYAPPWGIASFEAGYSWRNDDGEIEDLVMHARPAGNDSETIDSYILEADTKLGERVYPTGTWVIERKYHDDRLWSLVEDGILGSFSIGGRITEERAISFSDLSDDVDVPPEVSVGEDDTVSELRAGYITEVSDVDHPAVPNADAVALKTSIEKSAELTNPEQAQELLEDRGHSPENAARLAEYLTSHDVAMSEDDVDANEAASAEAESGAGKSDDAHGGADGAAGTDATADEAEAEDVELDNETKGFIKRLKEFVAFESPGASADNGNSANAAKAGGAATKVGQTLSQSSREAAYAAHDAIETLLSADDPDYTTNRLTDNPDVDFDVGYYTGKADGLDSSPEETLELATSKVDAIELAETTNETSESMTDETEHSDEAEKAGDESGDAPAWAADLVDKVEQNAAAIDDLAEKAEDDDGEADEAEKDADAEEDAEAPEWAKALIERTEKNSEAIDAISKQGGHSQQLHDIDAGEAKKELANLEREVFN